VDDGGRRFVAAAPDEGADEAAPSIVGPAVLALDGASL
jgi:hypothetical protein